MTGLPEKCLELILEQAGIIAVTDKYSKYIYVNKRWETDTGIPREVAIGSYAHDLIEGSMVRTVMQTGKTFSGNILIKTKNGKELPGIMNYMPIFQDTEIVGCFISSCFLNVNQAQNFFERLETISEQYEFLRGEMKTRSGANYSVEDITGKSDAVKRLKEQIYFAGASNSTVLINGETGTGKELVAHAIHSCGLRNIFPFIKVNCSAIPENLMESEFFGYDEGTFTGGKKGGKRGKFEKAHLGSIFLDEVNHLHLSMQPKLLRVLQEKEIEPLGTTESIPIDTRVIAATNIPLKQLVQKGLFREDLYYRLNIINIALQPLRKRKEDIPLLVENYIAKLNSQLGREIKGVTKEGLEYLQTRDWPGNIRELQNVLERAINASVRDELTRESFLAQDGPDDYDAPDIFHHVGQEDTKKIEKINHSLSENKETVEKELILKTIELCGGNKSKAAKMMNISRTLLYRKMEKYKIS